MFSTLHRLGGFIAKKRPHLRGDVVEESAPGQPIIGLLVDVPDFHAHPRAIKRCVGGSDALIPPGYRRLPARAASPLIFLAQDRHALLNYS